MLPSCEISGLHHFPPENPIHLPSNFDMFQGSMPIFHLDGFLNNVSSSKLPSLGREFGPQSSSLSNNSTSDDAEEQSQLGIIDERKQRRMISNRESARRSRMRKQKHLDELWSQVVRLRTENHNLIDKVNNLSECYEKIVLENVQLKDETSDLRQMLTDLQIGSPYTISSADLLH